MTNSFHDRAAADPLTDSEIEQWAAAVADGLAPFPVEVPLDQQRRIARAVAARRQGRLLRLIAQCLARKGRRSPLFRRTSHAKKV
ncbi:MAG TPA: hypothetical protein VGE52_18340 [Pirellulales bacterium]